MVTNSKTTKSHVSSLQPTEQHKGNNQNPIIQRRNKLIERLEVVKLLNSIIVFNCSNNAV
jgi:hypothetical protein